MNTVKRPFWQAGPCPAWCDAEHMDLDNGFEDRRHESDVVSLDLVLEDAHHIATNQGRDVVGKPARIDVMLAQRYREVEPIVTVWRWLNGKLTVTRMTLDEGERLAEILLDTVKGARQSTARLAISEAGLTEAQAGGLACVVCGADFTRVDVPHVPVGKSAGGSQVFACETCPVPGAAQ